MKICEQPSAIGQPKKHAQRYVKKLHQVVAAKGTSCKCSKLARYANLVVSGLLSSLETQTSNALGSSSTETKRVQRLSSSEVATWERHGKCAISKAWEEQTLATEAFGLVVWAKIAGKRWAKVETWNQRSCQKEFIEPEPMVTLV
jgi:hypothetical protein